MMQSMTHIIPSYCTLQVSLSSVSGTSRRTSMWPRVCCKPSGAQSPDAGRWRRGAATRKAWRGARASSPQPSPSHRPQGGSMDCMGGAANR